MHPTRIVAHPDNPLLSRARLNSAGGTGRSHRAPSPGHWSGTPAVVEPLPERRRFDQG